VPKNPLCYRSHLIGLVDPSRLIDSVKAAPAYRAAAFGGWAFALWAGFLAGAVFFPASRGLAQHGAPVALVTVFRAAPASEAIARKRALESPGLAWRYALVVATELWPSVA
jgi:hypothetical protein